MKPEEAIKQMEELMVIDDLSLVYLPVLRGSFELAVKALREQRPHGEWEGHVERKNLNTRKCTSCGEYGAVGNFCMWCGADMMREGDEK